MIFPYYHTVSDVRLNHIRNIFPYRTVSRFKQDMETLLRHFRPASLDELVAWQKDPSSMCEPHFFLSFDDGLREVYEIVAPLLKKMGIPATFFLNTDFIDNRDLFYRYNREAVTDGQSDQQ